MQSGQRPIRLGRVQAVADHAPQVCRIARHIFGCGDRPRCRGGDGGILLCRFQQRGNVLALQSAARTEKFKAVALPRMVARRDLYRAVTPQIHGRHEHGGCRAQAAFQHLSTRTGQPPDDGVPHALSRKAAVAPDGDAGGRLAALFFKPDGKGSADSFHYLVGQGQGLAFHTLHGHAANVRSAFKTFPKLRHCVKLLFRLPPDAVCKL